MPTSGNAVAQAEQWPFDLSDVFRVLQLGLRNWMIDQQGECQDTS